MNEKKEKFTEVVMETGRSAWLAGLGTVVTIEEGAERLLHNTRKELKENVTRIAREAEQGFQRLIERGRTFEEERKTARPEGAEGIKEGSEAMGSVIVRVTHKTEAAIRSTVEYLLHRLEVPTREEIQAITERIERLQSEIESLRRANRELSA